jgi:transmembrane sensor
MAPALGNSDAAERAAHEAIVWFVRLDKKTAGHEDREAFEAWLAADPAHAEAMREIRDLWSDLDGSAARLGADGWHRIPEIRSSGGRTWRLAMAAGFLIAVLAGAMLWRDSGLIDRAFADYATRPGEHREFQLADGTQVYLDGDTAITRAFGPDHRDLTLLRGRVWLDVAKDPDRPFVVHAGGIETRVLGTAFGVDREAADVAVDHGTVAVSAGSGAEQVRLTDGQRVALSGNRLGVPTTIDPRVALAWRRGLIVLDSAPLGDVADQLARMAPGRVLIPDGDLRSLPLSGVFSASDPDAVLEVMRTALGLKTLSVPGFATIVYR